jgi:bifunctional non-homologous end joining protein LigD
MLATTGALPRDDSGWSFEIKWDGVRALTYIDAGRLRMESRNLADITPRYPELHEVAAAMNGRGVVLDGEVVTFDEAGRPSFGLLQHRMHVADAAEVRRRMLEYPAVYMIFDVLWLDGEPAMGLPYTQRRDLLAGLELTGPSWQVPSHHVGDGEAMSAASRARGLEGVVAKRMAAPYEPGKRSRSWLKIKNVRRQEVVIGGWLPGEGNRSGRLGALLIGVNDETGLRFAGKVGTGFSDRMLSEIGALLASLEQSASPFVDKVPWRQARYVRPELVGDVEFTEWTSGGTLRHPSFKGLRDDKTPHQVVREPTSGT